jgi:hypothetical protein
MIGKRTTEIICANFCEKMTQTLNLVLLDFDGFVIEYFPKSRLEIIMAIKNHSEIFGNYIMS